jgi:glycosyltransferase involved in cell wall biosynthesis
MQRIPDSPPQIRPVLDAEPRPVWSVMIPAYNCANYLIEAINSVLQQDPGQDIMQIEVVDDCSTDADVEELVKKVGKGRVGYFRQLKNVGSLRNFETCIKRSRGKFIHLLHGDDRVKKGYYIGITSLFTEFPEAGAAFCAWEHIDSDGKFTHKSRIEMNKPGILDNWLYKLAEHPRLQYVAMTVKREVYEALGSFYMVHYGEDWEMWSRIAKDYPTAYLPEYLAEYREHMNSITSQSYQTGQNVKDISKVTAQIISYLPLKDRRKKLRLAQKNYVYWIVNETFNAWLINKDNRTAYSQIKTILSIYQDLYVLRRVAVLLAYMWTNPLHSIFKRSSNS